MKVSNGKNKPAAFKIFAINRMGFAATRFLRSMIRIALITAMVTVSLITPTAISAQSPHNGTVTIKGEVFNASTGKPVSGVRIRLFKMGNGLDPILSLENAGPRFQFDPIPASDGTLLIAVDYHDETYFQMLHSADTNFTLPQRVIVFDAGASPKTVRLTAMVHVEKTNNGLSIEKTYLVMNGSTPAQSLDTENIRFQIPEGAKDIEAYLRLETTNLSLPVNITKESQGYKIDRDFRPGTATLSIKYRIEADHYMEQMPDVTAVSGEPPISHNFFALGWKPDDVKPEITGAQSEEMKVPGMGKALKLTYEDGATIEYDFSRGSFITENLLNAHFNPIFSSPGLSIMGLLLFTGVLLILIPYAANSGFGRDLLKK